MSQKPTRPEASTPAAVADYAAAFVEHLDRVVTAELEVIRKRLALVEGKAAKKAAKK